MNFRRGQLKDFYLLDTGVENIFINEYMTAAPGDYVKVYLYALMYADLSAEMSNESIAKQLFMEAEDVLKAWTYWEGLGLVRKHYKTQGDKFNYEIEFINQKELLYGKTAKKKEPLLSDQVKGLMDDKEIRDMYGAIEKTAGRLLGGKEPMEIMSWITDYKATPEIILYAYTYCVKTRKKDSVKYVGAVVKEWMEKNLDTAEKIDEHLESVDKSHFQYKRVLKALGFTRNATEAEKRLMDSWFTDMEFPMDTVLEACGKTSGIASPNMNYVNKILTDWHKGKESGQNGGVSGKPVGVGTVLKYYDFIRENAEREAQRRKEQIYKEIPRIKEIDNEMRNYSMQVSKIMISGDVNRDSKMKDVKRKADKLNEERAFLLAENNFEINYMETKYRCAVCKDTGTNDMGERCECFSQRLSEAEQWQNSLKG